MIRFMLRAFIGSNTEDGTRLKASAMIQVRKNTSPN